MNNTNMMSSKNSTSACSLEYVISPELHLALINGSNLELQKYKKIPCYIIPGVWLCRFRIVNNKGKATISISFLFYTDLFVDPLLLYLIGKYNFINSNLFMEWDNFYTFIDKNLTKDKKGIIEDLAYSPDKYNDYLQFDDDKTKFDNDVNYHLKKYVFIKDIDEIIYLLLLAYNGSNLYFFKHLYKGDLNTDYVRNTSVTEANLLKEFLVVIKDINSFINDLNKVYGENIINQGIKKFRGLVSSMDSFLSVLDLDFRRDLFRYNRYHIEKGTISPKLSIPWTKLRFNNVNMNLGITRWYTTKTVNINVNNTYEK